MVLYTTSVSTVLHAMTCISSVLHTACITMVLYTTCITMVLYTTSVSTVLHTVQVTDSVTTAAGMSAEAVVTTADGRF